MVACAAVDRGDLAVRLGLCAGEASYLAVTEYSAFLWAAVLGWLVFRERVSPYTLGGRGADRRRLPGRRAAQDARSRRRSTSPPSCRPEHVDREREHADVEDERGEAMDGHDLADVRLGDLTSDVANAIPQVKAK